MATASADPDIQRYNGVHDRQGRPAPALSIDEAERAIARFTTAWRDFDETGVPTGVAFAIADATSGELVGCCGVDDWNGEDVAQFGYWVTPSARGQGYATRAATLLTRWLFERGAARVFLTIVADNHASAAVARRAGFEHEGIMRDHSIWRGRRCDVWVFAALATEWAPSARTHEAEDAAKVVTLCGSTRFEAEFAEVNQRLTMEGCVVISLGTFRLPDLPDYDWTADSADLKRRLGGVHLHKIRMADEVYVVDPGGYVGESTRGEIAYAESLGTPVRYLSHERKTGL